MNGMKIKAVWPVLEAGGATRRYADALQCRLQQLGFATVNADEEAPLCLAMRPEGYPAPLQQAGDERCIEAVPCLSAGAENPAGRMPYLFDEAAFWRSLPPPLATHEVRDWFSFVAIAGKTGGEAQQLVRIKQRLAHLAPRPIRFTVLDGQPDQLLYREHDIECVSSQGDAYARALQGADAILLDAANAGAHLYAASLCEVPVVIAMSGSHRYPGAGIGVADATPDELAGLMLLVSTDPPVRRRTLDTQAQLRRAHQPQAQRDALAHWLASAGVTLPERAVTQSGDAAEKPVYRVEGVFDSSYSLAIVNRHLAMAIHGAGQRVTLHTYEQGDAPQPNFHAVEQPDLIHDMWQRSHDPRPPRASLRNAWPPVVRDMRGARRVLASYAWEETAFPEKFVEEFNQTLDLIAVVSSQTARVLRDAGVRTPMAVVGNGVDHLLNIEPAPLPRELPSGFRFLHVSSCFPRKGADVLLRAYGQAFRRSDDVTLIIKTFPNPHNDVARQLADWRVRDPEYPRVELIEEDWTGEQIVGLYRACQVLVAPSRGEGFGLPVAEAMLQGLPVITTNWGGQLDFCNDETVWLIDYNPELAQTHINLPDSLWAEPSVESLKQRLQELHALPQPERDRKTERARKQILDRYTWRQVGERTLAALAAIDALPAPLPQPRIGWISTWGSRCGIAAYSSHLSAAFPVDRLNVYAPHNETVEVIDNANISRNWLLGTGQLDHVVEQALSHKLDALVVQFNWAFMSLEALSNLIDRLTANRIKIYVFFHNTSSDITARLADIRPALNRCERLLVHSVGDIQRLKKLGYSDNVTLFPLGVYPVRLPAPATLTTQRQSLGLTRKKIVATYGFLMPHKGLSVMVEALPRIIAAHPDVHLLMVNAIYNEETSGPELQRLQSRIAALGLRDRVTLKTDFLPEEESLGLLAMADLIVFPYQASEESSSAAVRMALLAERPVAVTPLSIFSDVAPSCATLPGTDADALATGVSALMKELGQEGREQAYIDKARDYVTRHNTKRLSRRLYNIIDGCFVQGMLGG
jgi:glycosyltransferase involved in cell wall biosynthesis